MKRNRALITAAIFIAVLVLPSISFSYMLVDDSGCLTCHERGEPGGDTGLHGNSNHTDCAQCHTDGETAEGTVAPSACIACHPAGNSGQCNLVNDHDPGRGATCLSCHSSACAPDDTPADPATDPCPAEQIYGENSAEVVFLRHYRDEVLSKTEDGRNMIKLYYQLAPVISARIQIDPAFRALARQRADEIISSLGSGR